MDKIFYDAEFVERGKGQPIWLVSIGMVRESDGAEYYAVNADLDEDLVHYHEWDGMRDHVWAQLPTVGEGADSHLDWNHPDVKYSEDIAAEVSAFVLGVPDPELWASYCAYDHVVLCQLFGTMARLPEGFPMFTNDIKSYSVRLGDPRWPAQKEREHHALHDARYARDVWKFLRGVELGAYVASQPEAAP